MKIFKELLYSLLVILLATSCVEERIPSGAQIADVPCVLNAAKSALSFSAVGASGELEINSKNVPWELTGAPEWLTVSQTSGTGTATVTSNGCREQGCRQCPRGTPAIEIHNSKI